MNTSCKYFSISIVCYCNVLTAICVAGEVKCWDELSVTGDGGYILRVTVDSTLKEPVSVLRGSLPWSAGRFIEATAITDGKKIPPSLAIRDIPTGYAPLSPKVPLSRTISLNEAFPTINLVLKDSPVQISWTYEIVVMGGEVVARKSGKATLPKTSKTNPWVFIDGRVAHKWDSKTESSSVFRRVLPEADLENVISANGLSLTQELQDKRFQLDGKLASIELTRTYSDRDGQMVVKVLQQSRGSIVTAWCNAVKISKASFTTMAKRDSRFARFTPFTDIAELSGAYGERFDPDVRDTEGTGIVGIVEADETAVFELLRGEVVGIELKSLAPMAPQ